MYLSVAVPSFVILTVLFGDFLKLRLVKFVVSISVYVLTVSWSTSSLPFLPNTNVVVVDSG